MDEGRSLSRWFEHWVDQQPDALALTGDDGVRLTYAELEVAANRIANAIDALDAHRAFPIVAVAIDQSSDAVVAILGASKSGRTVVPLDVAAPPGRIADTLAQLDPAVALTRDGDDAALADTPTAAVRLLRIDELDASVDARRVVRPIDIEGIEVVQFTSGSAGRPKGVPRPTRAAIGGFLRVQEDGHLGPGSHVALTSDFQWAAGWATVRLCFATGSSLHQYSTRRRGPTELASWLREEGVTRWSTIPSLLQATVDAAPPGLVCTDLHFVGVVGEMLHRSLVEQVWPLLAEDAIIRNVYSATETGEVSRLSITRATVLDSEVVPVGPPLRGVEVTIADPDEDGVGEIIVTSSRGSLGYLGHDPDDRITAHPNGLTTYRTGDQGRMRPDGMLELRGRSDRMVKVRGHRVDLNEVEIALRELPEVAEAAAGLHHERGVGRITARITAWIVPARGRDVDVSLLRRELRKRLPGYMVPSAFVFVLALPRTTRGKLDRSQLPEPSPGRPEIGAVFEAPQGAVEEAVAAAFASVLAIEPIGRHDPFFDLGGDSLHAVEAMTMIAATLGRDLPLSVFVEAETPAQLAATFAAADATAGERLVVLQADGDRPPIYCVHGGGGQVLSFATLATRMGAGQPFIGIQMRSRDRARVLFRVRRLARVYAREVASRQAGRPCVIAGHSYGAVVAFEIARQLRVMGVPVEACILLDCTVPDRRLLRGRVPLGLLIAGDDDAVRRWKELAYAAHAVLGLRPRPNRLVTERMHAALWGMSLYRPEDIDVPLVVVHAVDGAPGRDLSRWAAYTSASCVVVPVPGDHNSILTPPHLHRLADALLGALDATRASTG